jgi:hypothetical protein
MDEEPALALASEQRHLKVERTRESVEPEAPLPTA